MEQKQIKTLTFDRREAAKKLGISLVTLDRELARKRIGHVRIGRRVLFTEELLHRYVAEMTEEASSGAGRNHSNRNGARSPKYI